MVAGSAIQRRANLIGITANRIHTNARLHRLIYSLQTNFPDKCSLVIETLIDKGCYTAALSSTNPEETLILFAEIKRT